MAGAPSLGARNCKRGCRTSACGPPTRRRGRLMRKLTAVDLFCGAGGLTEGLKQAGFRVLGAIDNAPLAVETYQLNHRTTRVWLRDIRRMRPLDMAAKLGLGPGDLDLLAACPP